MRKGFAEASAPYKEGLPAKGRVPGSKGAVSSLSHYLKGSLLNSMSTTRQKFSMVMSSTEEILAPRRFYRWFSSQTSNPVSNFRSHGRKRRRRSSSTSIKSNIKALLAAGLSIKAIRLDGEILVGDVRERELNDWDQVLPENSSED